MRVNSLESDYYRASFMKNLLTGDCSESEGSSSKGDSSTGNEGRGTSEELSSASTSSFFASSGHTSPGSAFLCGEAGESGVNLGGDLLRLEPGSLVLEGVDSLSVRGSKASCGCDTRTRLG